MNAIILTEDQAAQLLAARGPNDIRVLEPRRLQDGRLILNADILDDPYFADPSRPWAAVLGIAPQEVAEETVEQTGAPTSGVQSTDTPIVTNPSSLEIVELTDAELAEPQ
jgi:hypothetical protein